MAELAGRLEIHLTVAEVAAFLVTVVACLMWAPFMVRHWRGTYDRLEEGVAALPFRVRQRTKDRMMATFHYVIIGIGSMAAGVLLDSATPRVPVVPDVLVLVFFVCMALFFTGWFFGRPAWMLPPRYRRRR